MLEITASEDGFLVGGGANGPRLVTMAGKSAALNSGWNPASAVGVTGDYIFLNLSHVDGNEATWILDKNGCFVAGDLASLADSSRSEILVELGRWIKAVVDEFIHATTFGSSAEVTSFFLLSSTIRTQLVEIFGYPELPAPNEREIVRQGDHLGISDERGLDESYPFRRACASLSIDDRYVDACSNGSLEWISPVDGLPVSMRGMVISHMLTAWRGVDQRNGIVFFVLVSGFNGAILSVWLPSNGTITELEMDPRDQFSVINNKHHLAGLRDHLFKHGRLLTPFFKKPVARVAHFTWPVPAVHLGHFHWNEFPGLEKIATLVAQQDYPLIYDLGGSTGNSFYGKLTNIYPELCAIDQSCQTMDQMSAHAYLRGIQPLRFAGSYVSAAIRKRIGKAIGLVEWDGGPWSNGQTHAGPSIAIGLRVENRTATNLVEFYVRLMETITKIYGSSNLVIDGHNSAESSHDLIFQSNMQARSSTTPLEVERQQVAELKERLAGLPICIIDCVGMTLRQNLAQLQHADLCVAPWGAGLAKYRWALNKQTFVTMSNHNRKYKSDINIYASEVDMESPAPYFVASSGYITDQDDAPLLIDVSGPLRPHYANYTIDIEQVVAEVIFVLGKIMKEGKEDEQ